MKWDEAQKFNGLSDEQVAINLQKYGENTLTKSKKINPIVAYFKQFIDPMVDFAYNCGCYKCQSGYFWTYKRF